jgi:hypothetical protein
MRNTPSPLSLNVDRALCNLVDRPASPSSCSVRLAIPEPTAKCLLHQGQLSQGRGFRWLITALKGCK